MKRTKVPRLSGCLVVFGNLLLIPGLLLLLFGCLALAGVVGSTTKVVSEQSDEIYASALRSLEAIEGGPWPFVEEFRKERLISEKTLEAMPDPPKSDVEFICDGYSAAMAGTAAGAGMFAMLGLGVTWGLLSLGVPLFLVGLLLTLKKKVWRCKSCGHVLERS